jgi:hypothetical protein
MRTALSRDSPRAVARRSGLSSVVSCLNLGIPGRFGHFIGGEFVEPSDGQYFDNLSPVDGQPFIQAAQGTKADVDRAVEVASSAFTSTWSKTSVTDRSNMLLKMADIVEANAERLAKIETLDNGKAVRETLVTDVPLAVDHFRLPALSALRRAAHPRSAPTLCRCASRSLWASSARSFPGARPAASGTSPPSMDGGEKGATRVGGRRDVPTSSWPPFSTSDARRPTRVDCIDAHATHSLFSRCYGLP